MKRTHHPVLLAAMATLAMLATESAFAADAAPGDTLQDARQKMGTPRGVFRMGEHQLLMYERGVVEVYEGYVVQADLISEKALAEQDARAERSARERQRAEATRRRERLKEGEAEWNRVRAHETFEEKPIAQQVVYWEQFRRTYPDVDTGDTLKEARAKLRKEHKAEQERLAMERAQQLASAQPEKKLSARKKRRAQRRMEPGKPVETASYTPPYRRLGGSIADWPY